MPAQNTLESSLVPTHFGAGVAVNTQQGTLHTVHFMHLDNIRHETWPYIPRQSANKGGQ